MIHLALKSYLKFGLVKFKFCYCIELFYITIWSLKLLKYVAQSDELVVRFRSCNIHRNIFNKYSVIICLYFIFKYYRVNFIV